MYDDWPDTVDRARLYPGEVCKYGFDSSGKAGAFGAHSYPWNKQTRPDTVNFIEKLGPSQTWKFPNVYSIEKIELHEGYVPESFLNDLSMIITKMPVIADDNYIKYGILARSSFTPKSRVSHIVTTCIRVGLTLKTLGF